MILSGMMGMLAYICLIYPSTVFILKMFEFSLALFKCIEIAYYSYLFVTIKDKKYYQMAIGCATAGVMSGKCVSGLLGQLIVYYIDHDYSIILYCSFAGVTFASVWACFLPSVDCKNHLHEANATEKVFSKAIIHDPGIPKYSTEKVDPKNSDSIPTVVKKTLKRTYDDILVTYVSPTILFWSFWHILSMTGYTQIYLYINILYTYVLDETNDKNMLLNGLVECLATMSAAICTYRVGKINIDWTRYGGIFLTLISLVLGFIVYLCYYLKKVMIIYIIYIVYNTLVQSGFVIVISQIGAKVKNDRYSLVLGFNTFLGMLLGMCSTTILTSTGTSIPGHFLVYGGTYIVLGIVYGFIACIKKKTVT